MRQGPNRKLNRLKDFDYSQSGWYFVTVCVQDRECLFGKIENGQMVLNELGIIVRTCWLEIPKHYPNVRLDEFVIMPNHVHGIIVIKNHENFVGNKIVGNKNFCSLLWWNKNFCSLQPWQTKLSRSLSSIARGFKIGVTKWCRENDQNEFAWQKSFHDHIIRHEKSYWAIKKYIQDNPRRWEIDRNNPENLLM